MTADTATPDSARRHARAQAVQGEAIAGKPTIPAATATDLPVGVAAADLVWVETVPGAGYTARVLERGTRVRLENLEGDACVNLLAFNADAPAERLNVADTVKVQWQAYLGAGALLLSDMGRVLLSITADSSGRHDALCGSSNARANAMRYGDGANQGPHPSARDRFTLALAKYGLGRRDVGPSLNLFKGVRVEADGGLRFDGEPGSPGEHVELRAEMRVLLVLVNTPHVLDPRPRYTVSPFRVIAWRGPIAAEDDPLRTASPERLRAFQNVEDYYTR